MSIEKSADKPLVSVFCTVHNHEKYIRHCLDGFLMQQTNFPFEVLVHDDASTDGSAKIIREYEEKYPNIIKAIYQKENQYSKKVKIVKTFLLPKAQGEFIARCEGDDYWTDPQKLQKQVDAMRAHPECRLCVHVVEDVSEDEIPIGVTCPKQSIPTGMMSSEEFIGKNGDFFQLSSYFHYRSDLEKYYNSFPYFAQISDVGDKPFMLYFGQLGDVFYINEPMSCYRQNSDGGWTTNLIKGSREKVLRHLETTVRVFREFDIYSKGRFSSVLRPIILCAEFEAARVRFPYREPLRKQYREIYNGLPRKAKLRIWVFAMLPHLVPKIEAARRRKLQNGKNKCK